MRDQLKHLGLIMIYMALLCILSCQAHAPKHGSLRTEDVSPVIYNYHWLKSHVLLRNLKTQRLEGDLLQVIAQFHLTEEHTSRRVYARTEFYQPAMSEGGVVVDSSDWTNLVFEPRKRVQYTATSLVPADDFRIYVTYGEDIGKP